VSPEDMQRFRADAAWHAVLLSCTRCEDWEDLITDSSTLAELVQRAGEHTEVCR
jgi:hypothetical protein